MSGLSQCHNKLHMSGLSFKYLVNYFLLASVAVSLDFEGRAVSPALPSSSFRLSTAYRF